MLSRQISTGSKLVTGADNTVLERCSIEEGHRFQLAASVTLSNCKDAGEFSR